jgi:hypothetical protein
LRQTTVGDVVVGDGLVDFLLAVGGLLLLLPPPPGGDVVVDGVCDMLRSVVLSVRSKARQRVAVLSIHTTI